MYKKHKIYSSILVFIVLFAMLFRSVHSFEHLFERFSEEKCQHKNYSKDYITHKHNSLNHCYICDFSFSHFISSSISISEFDKYVAITKATLTYSKQITLDFKGGLFQLRAPPNFIV